jgi:hypothetical protein
MMLAFFGLVNWHQVKLLGMFGWWNSDSFVLLIKYSVIILQEVEAQDPIIHEGVRHDAKHAVLSALDHVILLR